MSGLDAWFRAIVVGAVVMTATSFSRPSFADATPAQKAAAEALFDQAKALMIEGKYAEACRKFEQSQAVEPGIGTMLYLAECYEKEGRTASAWALFREASSLAEAADQVDRAQAGRRRAEALEPRLSKLTIAVEPDQAIDQMVIRRSGQAVPRVLWGVAVPVDPGSHRIEVEAPGYRAWQDSVAVGDNGASVTVKVPPLERATEVSAAPALAPSNPMAPPPSAASDEGGEERDAGAAQRTLGFVVGGIGIVGMGVGGFFGLRAISKNDEAEDFCPGGGAECFDQRGVTLTDEAQTAATIANIGVIGGAVLTAAGLFIVLSAPDDAPTAGLTLRTEIARTRTSVSLTGAF